MKTIHKYEFQVENQIYLTMPTNAKVIYAGVQQPGHICLLAEVDPSVQYESRVFYVLGTGYQIVEEVPYIGTVFDGPYVWHIYGKN